MAQVQERLRTAADFVKYFSSLPPETEVYYLSPGSLSEDLDLPMFLTECDPVVESDGKVVL